MARPTNGLHPEEIKARIRQQDKSLTGLSMEWGYHRTAISTALGRPWPSVQDRIAKFINLAPERIWPDRYSSEGTPLRGYRTKAKNTIPRTQRNNQYATAA